MKKIKPQPRTAVLICDAFAEATVDGTRWITDRYVLARESLFRKPPTKFSGKLNTGSARHLLREFTYADTVPLQRTRLTTTGSAGYPLGARPLVGYAHQTLLVLVDQKVADGLTAAGLFPHLVMVRGKHRVAWYQWRNSAQVTLMAVQMPISTSLRSSRTLELVDAEEPAA